MTSSLLPNGEQVFLSDEAVPLAGGSVYHYVPGTDTLKDTWTDIARVTLNSNPITLDSAGRAIIWGYGVYRQVVLDSLGNTIWDQLTSDWGSPLNAIQVVVDELAVELTNLQNILNTTTSYIKTTIYNTEGDHIFTPGPGTTALGLELLGGGGGSEGVATPGSAKVSIGSGGSGGEWVKTALIVTGIVETTVHVGAGGTAGAAGNNPGVAGADSTGFGYTASGGLGGTSSTDAVTPPVNATSIAGGSGGSGPDIVIQTPGGASGTELTQTVAAVSSGSGGSSHYGTGGPSATCGTNASTAGKTSTGQGAGGSGACASGTGPDAAGAAGGAGQIIINEYGSSGGSVTPGVTAATQSDEEAGTSTTKFTNPGVQQFHDSSVKAAALVASDGTLLYGYNVTSSSHLGDPGYLLTFTNAFLDTDYCVVATAFRTDGTVNVSTQTESTVVIRPWRNIQSTGPEPTSSKISMMAMGRAAAIIPPYQAPAVFWANAAHPAAASIYLRRSDFLTGVLNSSTGVFSIWLKSADLGGTTGILSGLNSVNPGISPIIIDGIDANNGYTVLALQGPSPGYAVYQRGWDNVVDNTWFHLLYSWNTNFGVAAKHATLYQNDNAQSPYSTTDGDAAFQVNYNTGADRWIIGCNVADLTNPGYSGDMADLQFYPGTVLDISVEANRRLFIDADGKPVDPAVAVAALGNPAILFSGDATTFGTNQGSGGTFLQTGVFTNSSTSPSD